MKKKILLSALLILTCTLTACGKKDRMDIDKDLGGNTTESAGTSDKISDEEIPESLSYTVGGVTVDAKVSADGYEQTPVYKVKKKEKNDDWIRSYAEFLFDGGEYVNVKPYHLCSKDELEEEKEFWEEELSELTEADTGYWRIKQEIDTLEFEMDRASGRADESYAEDKLIYENDFSEEGAEGGVLENHTEYALLRGNADGDVWQLGYDYREYEHIIDGEPYTSVSAPILYGICPKKAKYYNTAYGIDLGLYQNSCSRATAEANAEKLLDRLGFNDMEQVYISELLPQLIGEEGENNGVADYCDGYAMVYAPVFGNLKTPTNMCSIEAFAFVDESETEITMSAMQPRVIILVNSEGVFSFCIIEDYEIEETLTEHSSMLTFEQIDSIAKDKFGALNNVHTTITDVNFGYMCITYDDASYAMVPVWSYCMEFDIMASHSKLPLINICALDGTVITTSTVPFNYEYGFLVN